MHFHSLFCGMYHYLEAYKVGLLFASTQMKDGESNTAHCGFSLPYQPRQKAYLYYLNTAYSSGLLLVLLSPFSVVQKFPTFFYTVDT